MSEPPEHKDRDEERDEPADATIVGGAPPPAPSPAAPPAGEAEPAATIIGSAPPPAAAPPTSVAPDATEVGSAPPPAPSPPPAKSAPPPEDAAPVATPAPAPGPPPTAPPADATQHVAAPDADATAIAPADDATRIGDASATVVASGAALAPAARLRRIAPAQHEGEVVMLDATRADLQVGRHEACEVRLYSSAASRQHARIWCDAKGAWWIRPAQGKSVRAGKRELRKEQQLKNGMRLTLGDDAFDVEIGTALRGAARPGTDRATLLLWAVIAALVASIGIVLFLR